ncbi:hypothetical protein D3C87_299100 [compost metagenome]|uniref:hypothetical protein n=1 Tax=Pedobacter sp. MC2016-24 TaxID=2780090 RepID=UPI000FADDA32|nr:hypothetical protein [Pedobacter sp. MC2016-24]MBE9598695.1 hypothetical protein [Pedobacter sp. MC2016-24]
MKSLDQLNNLERGALLHQLFPNEMPDLLDFIEGMCISIKEDEEGNRKVWKLGLMTFDFWLSLLNQVEAAIKQYGKKLTKSHRLFTDQLFDGLLACFTIHCITVYVTLKQHPNPKFTKAVELLF